MLDALIRKGYQCCVPLSVRERLWDLRHHGEAPHYSDTRDSKVKRRLAGLKGAYTGHRCFIMGNGPSLNKMDLRLFSDEYVWGSNRCYLLFERIQWRPAFFVSVDTRVLPDIADDVNRLMHSLPRTRFFFPVAFRREGHLEWKPNVYWYNEVMPEDVTNPAEMFSFDVTVRVSAVRTVTVAALQLAVHLGFNPIYLIGCDTSYTVPSSVKCEGAGKDNLVSEADDDCNHFDPRYFGKGRKWHEPHADRMLAHYRLTQDVCMPRGIRIYNATVGGQLEVFPRVDYREVLGRSPGETGAGMARHWLTDYRVAFRQRLGLC